MRYTGGLAVLLVSLLHCLTHAKQAPNPKYHGMQTFVTRPDIECASWKVSIYDEDALAPGYWFVSPYERNGERRPGGSWIGPHIYNNHGELVWSGSKLFNRINVMDFGMMNVDGEDLLSMSYAVEGTGYIMDNQYQVKQTVFEGITGETYNMHDFHTVDDGSRFLYLKRNQTHASAEIAKQDLGYDGQCSVTFPGFEERDVKTGDILFKWDATGIIPLSDSTMNFNPPKKLCSGGHWDYLHSNAIDKFTDGHYLLSTRHSDTIYKISKDDGSIIWRLHGHGGKRSDFEMGNLNFSRQHHARIHEQNKTHTIISFLDNCVGADPQPATSKWSRALLVALREDVMTAELISSIDNPQHKKTFRRGSYQILPNGGAFVGWSEEGLQSEHAPDGRLLMEARFVERRLGTYRTFKFPFVADPVDPPDIYSNASTTGNTTTTSVYMSWNGATEVAQWTLYKTDDEGDRRFQLDSVPRSGFETAIHYNGFAKNVFVEAKDSNGKVLGKSNITETWISKDISIEAIAEEYLWLQGESERSRWIDWILAFGVGVLVGVAIFAAILQMSRSAIQRWKGRGYARVATADADQFDETKLDDLSSSRSYRDRSEDDVFNPPEDDADEDDAVRPAQR